MEDLTDNKNNYDTADDIDPITLKEIKSETKIEFFQGKKFIFNIDTLYNSWLSTSKYINPFTNLPLPDDVIEKIKEYSEKIKIDIELCTQIYGGKSETLRVDKNIKLGDLIIEIFRKCKKLGGLDAIPDRSILLLSKDPINGVTQGSISIYNSDLEDTLESLGFESAVKILVTPYFRCKPTEIIYPKLYKYAKDNHIEWLNNLIPRCYKGELPKIHDNMKDDEFVQLKDEISMIINSINNQTILLKHLFYHFMYHKTCRLNVVQAKMVIDLIPDLQFKWIVEHIIYSLVVDKYNLKREGVEGYYFRDRYQAPSYNLELSKYDLEVFFSAK